MTDVSVALDLKTLSPICSIVFLWNTTDNICSQQCRMIKTSANLHHQGCVCGFIRLMWPLPQTNSQHGFNGRCILTFKCAFEILWQIGRNVVRALFLTVFTCFKIENQIKTHYLNLSSTILNVNVCKGHWKVPEPGLKAPYYTCFTIFTFYPGHQ